jgi:hypothetical protein
MSALERENIQESCRESKLDSSVVQAVVTIHTELSEGWHVCKEIIITRRKRIRRHAQNVAYLSFRTKAYLRITFL